LVHTEMGLAELGVVIARIRVVAGFGVGLLASGWHSTGTEVWRSDRTMGARDGHYDKR